MYIFLEEFKMSKLQESQEEHVDAAKNIQRQYNEHLQLIRRKDQYELAPSSWKDEPAGSSTFNIISSSVLQAHTQLKTVSVKKVWKPMTR